MDLYLLLYRDDYYNQDTDEQSIMEIIVGKNRNGSTGTCRAKLTLLLVDLTRANN